MKTKGKRRCVSVFGITRKEKLVLAFLRAELSEAKRHVRRLNKVRQLEEESIETSDGEENGAMKPAIHLLPTAEDLSKPLASKVAELAGQAEREGRRFTVALSGGSLMEILSRSLVSEPLRSAMDWTAWEVFWADERCVSLDSPDSNFAAAKKLLFDQVDIPRDQVHALDDRLEPAEAARAYQSTINRVLQPQNGQLPRFDLILLGMGEDGHTASLFPGHRLLQEVRQWAAPVFDAPKAPAERITLTLPVINQAREVIFVVTGENKASALQAVFQAEGGGHRLPAAMVSPIDGTLRWFLDSSAGKNLTFLQESSRAGS